MRRLVKKFRKEVKMPVYIPVCEGTFVFGKTVMITGGSGGIGKAIAIACVRNGASVVLAGRNVEKLNSVAQELLEKRKDNSQFVECVYLDISDVNSIRILFEEKIFKNEFHKIDVLVNNAGLDAGGTIGSTKEEQFDKTIATNLKGTYFMTQEFACYLKTNHIQGNILNISSASGNRPVISPYMLSKWGITGLTAGMAKKFIKYGIVVNGIAPGPTATNMLGLDGSNLFYERAPAQRFSDPTEVANLAIFLISDMGRMIVGDTVYITGGCGTITFDDIIY